MNKLLMTGEILLSNLVEAKQIPFYNFLKLVFTVWSWCLHVVPMLCVSILFKIIPHCSQQIMILAVSFHWKVEAR